MSFETKRVLVRAATALLLGWAAGVTIAPAAAQDLGDPLGFLRQLRELPLGTPRLPGMPGADAPAQAPEPGAAPDEPQPPADPLGNAALRPGTDPLPAAGVPAADPGQTPAAPEAPASGADPATALSEPAPEPGEAPPGSALPVGSTGADEAAAEPGAAPADPTAAAAAPGTEPSDNGTGPGETISSHALRPLRLGVLAGRDVRATMTAVDAVSEGLAQALGRSVDILPMVSYRAMIDAQQSQRIDGGFYSAEAYARAQAQCRCLEPLVAPRAGDGTSAYYAIIVAAPESGIASVADLSGKTIAVAGTESVGGRRMQVAALASEGYDLPGSAASLVEAASAEEAVRLVVEGEADAAFAWSSLEGELATGYSRGTLTNLVASGAIDMDEVAVVWRSPAITHGPVAVANALPDEDKARVEAYLLGLANAAPEAYDLLNPFYSGGYAAVEPDDYRGLDALATLELERDEPASGGADLDRTGEAAD